MSRRLHSLPALLTLITGLAGLAAGLFAALPYPALKSIGDRLAADGDLESLTFARYAALRFPLLAAGLILLALAAWVAFRPAAAGRALAALLAFVDRGWARLISDARSFFRAAWAARPGRIELIGLAVLVTAGLILRLQLIDRPIEYDEAYTFTEFARHSFRQVLTDYHAPNNHVFHTLLVRVSTLLFGDGLRAIRLPALLAGLALIPAIYLLGRALYDRPAGLIAAGMAAAVPVLVYKSVSARGYILLCLFTALTFALGAVLTRRRNPFGWLALGGLTALGAFTHPIMLYPYGVLNVWLLWRALAGDVTPAYRSARDWIAHQAASAALAGALTFLFYLPILVVTTLPVFLKRNSVVVSIGLEAFVRSLPEKLEEILGEWRLGLPPALLIFVGAGILLSILLHRRIARGRISLPAALALTLSAVLFAQRPNSIARIWLWMVPLLLVWSAAGWLNAARILFHRRPAAVTAFAALLVAGSLLWGGLFAAGRVPPAERVPLDDPDAPQVALFLKAQVTPDDVIVASDCSNAEYWYYSLVDGIPQDAVRGIKSRPFYRAFVIVYPSCHAETWQSVLQEYGPDYGFFDLSSARPLQQFGGAIVYQVDARRDLVDRAYGIQ